MGLYVLATRWIFHGKKDKNSFKMNFDYRLVALVLGNRSSFHGKNIANPPQENAHSDRVRLNPCAFSSGGGFRTPVQNFVCFPQEPHW